jgi:hypothetical protein
VHVIGPLASVYTGFIPLRIMHLNSSICMTLASIASPRVRWPRSTIRLGESRYLLFAFCEGCCAFRLFRDLNPARLQFTKICKCASRLHNGFCDDIFSRGSGASLSENHHGRGSRECERGEAK